MLRQDDKPRHQITTQPTLRSVIKHLHRLQSFVLLMRDRIMTASTTTVFRTFHSFGIPAGHANATDSPHKWQTTREWSSPGQDVVDPPAGSDRFGRWSSCRASHIRPCGTKGRPFCNKPHVLRNGARQEEQVQNESIG